MSTNINPMEGSGATAPTPPSEPPAAPAFDPAPWQEAGIINRDPNEVAQRLQLADALYSPDQRDQVLSRILTAGEQPILPPTLDMREAREVLAQYAQMREEGLIDPQGQQGGGYYDDEPPQFDFNQLPNMIGQVVDHRLQAWQQQQAQQQAEQQREQVIADAVSTVAESNRFPDGIAQAIHAETRQILAQNPLATPQQAAAAAAGRWNQQLAQYLQQAPPAPPAPPSGAPLPPGGVPPEAPKSIQEVRQRMLRAAQEQGMG